MKVSVIRDLEHSEEIISEISTSANSQTAIKRSDFSANDPYLVDLETFSRQLWVPNGNSKPYCKWYFERTRGQYLDHLAQLSGYNERQFKTEYPKHQKITKTDIAKYEMTWKQHPYDVCRGAEKNYELFVAEIKREKPTISEEYFKQIVAKAILLNSIDRIVKSKELGGYKSNMNAYIMSSLSFLSNGNLDLTYIWEHQEIQDKVKEKIEEIIPLIWDHITNISASGNQASNVNERTKRQACWESLKSKLGNVERFGNDMMQKDADDNSSYLNESQSARIKEAESVPSRCWFSVVEWANKNKELTLMERKTAYNLGVKYDKQIPLTFKQAQNALGILKRAKELGFKYEE